MVAASRPRWVSGSIASIRTSEPSSSGVKRKIGAARLCCSFKTIPAVRPMQRARGEHLRTVARARAIGDKRSDDPARGLPGFVGADLD